MHSYQLTRKRNMKRIVLRVKDGVVSVSAPPRVPKREIDKFVKSKQAWIEKELARPTPPKQELKHFDDADCLNKFNKIADDVYQLVEHKLPKKPELRVKNYKSRWGACFYKRGYIILNKQLYDKPIPAIEQVILHEYVHFLHPNHSKRFHKTMHELMPDYKERKKLLK